MIYSKYFGQVIKEKGTPNLSVSGFQKFTNIVFLEGQIEGLRKARSIEKENRAKFDMKIFGLGKQLTELTGNMEPKEVLDRLCRSEIY